LLSVPQNSLDVSSRNKQGWCPFASLIVCLSVFTICSCLLFSPSSSEFSQAPCMHHALLPFWEIQCFSSNVKYSYPKKPLVFSVQKKPVLRSFTAPFFR
jgi:hypothetical protein